MTTEQTLIRADIMVVDDQAANLNLMETVLKERGYGVRSFPRGRLALAAARQQAPDLILLDINMPEMNGFEVCENLKAQDGLSRIPVIFLSALDGTDDKLKGFAAGAVDYISKPFQVAEVQARVDAHVQIRQLQQQLERQNQALEATVAARTSELREAHGRLMALDRAKNDFLKLISHELRTPLTGVLGVGDLLLDEFGSFPVAEELREMYDASRQRILTILDDALLLTEIEVNGGRWSAQPVFLDAVVDLARANMMVFADLREVTLAVEPIKSEQVSADQELLRRAVQSLLETAIKFSRKNQTVRVSGRAGGDRVCLWIDSYGRGIPESDIARFFNIFTIGEALTPGGDLGLGPPLAQRILSMFDGSVTIENIQPAGIRFTVGLRKVSAH
jgi:two-component system sensor histidine kinase/response regulator